LLDQGLLDASTASSCGGGLLAVLPEAIELSPELVAPTDADPETVAFSVARATTRLLRKVSLGRTCLLVIDDVHDADSASLRLLSRLAQEAGTMAVAILMTAREGELNASGNAEEVADLSRAVKSIHLGALDGAASRALVERVAPALPEEVLAQVLGAAVGNSLYLGELAALLKARSTMVEAELPIPVGVKASIRSRLDRLPTLARRFVDALAVLGGQAPIQRASEIAGVPASAAAPALDLGAIAISERRARVSHALVRDVAYGALSDEDRDRLHLR
jgi:predicted ATPase